jgi:hypothetical protein
MNSRSWKLLSGAKKQISNGTVFFPTIIKTSWNLAVEDTSQMWAQTTSIQVMAIFDSFSHQNFSTCTLYDIVQGNAKQPLVIVLCNEMQRGTLSQFGIQQTVLFSRRYANNADHIPTTLLNTA